MNSKAGFEKVAVQAKGQDATQAEQRESLSLQFKSVIHGCKMSSTNGFRPGKRYNGTHCKPAWRTKPKGRKENLSPFRNQRRGGQLGRIPVASSAKIRNGNYFIHLNQDFRAKSHEVLRKSKTRVKMVNTPNPGFLPNRARIPRIRNNMGRNYAHY